MLNCLQVDNRHKPSGGFIVNFEFIVNIVAHGIFADGRAWKKQTLMATILLLLPLETAPLRPLRNLKKFFWWRHA